MDIEDELQRMFPEVETRNMFIGLTGAVITMTVPADARPDVGEILASGLTKNVRKNDPEGHVLIRTDEHVYHLRVSHASPISHRRTVIVSATSVKDAYFAGRLEAAAREVIAKLS